MTSKPVDLMPSPPWAPLGKLLMVVGVLLLLLGFALSFGPKLPWLGRFPGDIFIKREHVTVYFPIVSCVVISLILSLLVWFLSRWR